jgi:hypothetical protein
MNKVIGIVLIIAGLAFGYIGFNKVADNTASVKILGLEINASNESGKQQGYIFLGIAAVFFVGGIYTLSRSKK